MELSYISDFIFLCKLFEEILVIPRPHLNWELSYYQLIFAVYSLIVPGNNVIGTVLFEFDLASEAAEPRSHSFEFAIRVLKTPSNISRNIQWVIAWNGG